MILTEEQLFFSPSVLTGGLFSSEQAEWAGSVVTSVWSAVQRFLCERECVYVCASSRVVKVVHVSD